MVIEKLGERLVLLLTETKSQGARALASQINHGRNN
jgi:hypothetical protein